MLIVEPRDPEDPGRRIRELYHGACAFFKELVARVPGQDHDDGRALSRRSGGRGAYIRYVRVAVVEYRVAALVERRPQRPDEGRARRCRRASGKITRHVGRDVDAHDELAFERDSDLVLAAAGDVRRRLASAVWLEYDFEVDLMLGSTSSSEETNARQAAAAADAVAALSGEEGSSASALFVDAVRATLGGARCTSLVTSHKPQVTRY